MNIQKKNQQVDFEIEQAELETVASGLPVRTKVSAGSAKHACKGTSLT